MTPSLTARIPLVSSDALSPEQQRVHDRIVAGPRGTVVPPLRAALHNPELAEHWQQMGALLRYGTSVPWPLKEIAILVTARRWNAGLEWYLHEGEARRSGLDRVVIDAIRHAQPPPFRAPDEAAVYEYVCALQQSGRVPDVTYRVVHDRLGTVGIVELTALVGYYTMVAMTLNAHAIVQEGVGVLPGATTDEGGLTICATGV